MRGIVKAINDAGLLRVSLMYDHNGDGLWQAVYGQGYQRAAA